jgi:hypothetical protein
MLLLPAITGASTRPEGAWAGEAELSGSWACSGGGVVGCGEPFLTNGMVAAATCMC